MSEAFIAHVDGFNPLLPSFEKFAIEENRTSASPHGTLHTGPHTLGHRAPSDFVLDQVTRSTEGFFRSLDAASNSSAALELGGRERVGEGHIGDPLAVFSEELGDEHDDGTWDI